MSTIKLEHSRRIMLLLLIFTVGGIFGFLYEEIFYYIDLGYWVKRGTTFGPWIPIYGFGAVLICLTTERIARRPLLTFLLSTAVCGVFELFSGFVIDRLFHTRLWDYNTEIWNWGNIGGYICARSVLFFGVSAMVLRYIVYPALVRFSDKVPASVFKFAAIVPAALFASDITLSMIFRAV